MRLDLGSIVQAQFERELGAAEPQVLRGGIGVMAPAPQPASGVAANLSLPHLDVDAWQAAIDRLLQPPGRAAARGTSGAAASPPPNAADDVDSPYRPTTIALKVQDLTAGSRRLTRVVAGLTDEAGLWRANVDSDQLDGYIEYRPTRSGAGRIYARLARLNLPKSEVEQVESLLDQQPASVPALDIVVDDFELRGKHLGRAEVVASNRRSEDGSGREWQLSKLNLTMPEAQFNASGRWAAGGATHPEGTPVPRRADISFKLALNDSGALLDRLGLAQGDPRRQGPALGRRLVAGLAAVARLRAHGRADPHRDRIGPVPQGRPRCGAAAQRAQPAVVAAPAVARLPRPVRPTASRSTTSTATCRSTTASQAATTCACAASAPRC